MNCTVKKLFNGHVSVRSYIVEQSIAKNEPLKIKHGDGERIVSVPELKNGFQFHKHTFQSKFNTDQVYELIDFPWKTKPIIKENALDLS